MWMEYTDSLGRGRLMYWIHGTMGVVKTFRGVQDPSSQLIPPIPYFLLTPADLFKAPENPPRANEATTKPTPGNRRNREGTPQQPKNNNTTSPTEQITNGMPSKKWLAPCCSLLLTTFCCSVSSAPSAPCLRAPQAAPLPHSSAVTDHRDPRATLQPHRPRRWSSKQLSQAWKSAHLTFKVRSPLAFANSSSQ